MLKSLPKLFLFIFIVFWSCSRPSSEQSENEKDPNIITTLILNLDPKEESVSIFREGEKEPILVQHALNDFRPYIHPIKAPDGKGILTEFSPGHHKHQTGLYWGFTRVNDRDYFHNPQGDYWKKVALNTIQESGGEVKWQTVYQLLDDKGEAVMLETQTWTMVEKGGKYFLDLDWKGEAIQNLVIGKYDYGSLFLRMPWKEGIKGEIVNAARQKNQMAEGQPSMWVNVGMQVDGREDFANFAIFDHPENRGYPNKWRVDGQLGLGPAFTRDADWTIEKGETETIKLRLMVYTGEANDIQLTESWGEFSGRQGMYGTTELWGLAQKEGRDAKFLTPQEAVEAMTIKPGYKVNVWASEPLMTQPMAFCWDDKGRLWVAENRDYESRGHGFSNAGDSRILILEDTNGDGVADTQKVFLEGIAFPAAIAVGFDGLFLGAPPHLLFVPDKDGDDKADVEDIEILLTGWGIRDRHETLNSFHWGPDGWLYGLQGFATPSKIRKPSGDAKLYYHNDPFPEDLLEAEGVDINGGVWRYHPIKDRFEVVAHGFSNPWGIDYDAKGQLLMTACVIPHLWHVIPGGIYHRQGGQHFNPFVYEDIKTIADHSHRSAHGGARVYQSDAFPKEEQGRIFMANIHEHAVLSDILIPKGSGYQGKHGDDFLMANNAQWVGFSMEIGPDGGLYVLDWHDADICGQEVLNQETGRIFRTMPEKSFAKDFEGRYADLNLMTDLQLVELQKSVSDWHARRARGILQKRASRKNLHKTTHTALKEIFLREKNQDFRLRAMWALHQIQGFSENELVNALSDKDPHIRAWAIQLLCEDFAPSSAAISQFRKMSQNDPSPVVRLYLAAALQRMPSPEKLLISKNLLQHKEDANDHNLPKMLWYGIEPLMVDNVDAFLDLAGNSKIPLVTQFIARRAVDGDGVEKLVELIGKNGPNTEILLTGMLSGMEGRNDLSIPSNWRKVSENLQSKGGIQKEIAMEISNLFGDAEATQRALATLKNPNAPFDQRKKALQTLTAQQNRELPYELPALIKDPSLRTEAIRSVAAFDNETLGRLLINSYSTFNNEEKQAALESLSSRARYGNMLSKEIKDKKIPKSEISPTIARQLLRVVGSGFIEIWGPIEQVANDKAAYDKYRAILTSNAIASANIVSGKKVFNQVCGSCHKMYGEGGEMGPDLTGSNRSDQEYILLNVLEPSAEIQDAYKMVVINTRDGRTYTGNVIGENQRQITLRVVGQDPIIINKSSIQSKDITEVSMMPPGLFENLTEKEIVELMAYLKTNKKVD
ncbi:PVC-type heme-binding CxxCH protein [Shivajiella indica]|uniref:PVC-type heme-binding CxxCH protein n=1 Tax=Shivajiella indica TaxID=872115 RepID=A0ABW5BCU4_9BACT